MVILLIAVAFAIVSEAGVNIDFSKGIPDYIKLYDLDGLAPASDLAFTGLKAGTAWTACDVERSGSRVAVSTSWYNPAGKANDWMVVPDIEIADDTELRWTARAFDAQLPDGYSVYISFKGETPEDFDTATPLFSVKAESPEWTDHVISLREYSGRSASIAFVNDSEDCNLLMIKSIAVGEPEKLIVNFIGGRSIVAPGEKVPLKFKVSTVLTSGQNLLKAGCSFSGKEFTLSNLGMLEPGSELEFEFPDASFMAEKGVLTPVTVWVESDLGKEEKTFYFGNCLRRMAIEESTGTWCGYCVGGIVALENAKEKYPDQTLCVAIHCGHDGMAISGYDITGSGSPRVVLNRDGESFGPAELEDRIKPCLDDVPEVYLEAEWTVSGDNAMVNATLVPGLDSVDRYNLAFVLVENDVHVPDDPAFNQHNYYSGGSLGEMGGFENLPDPIPASQMWYQDVARGIYPSYKGVNLFTEAPLRIGEESECSYSFVMPENVLVQDNLEVIVLAINPSTLKVVNGCKAVKIGTGSQPELKSDNVSVLLEEWYDITGRRVSNPSGGVFIRVSRCSDGSTRSEKILMKH